MNKESIEILAMSKVKLIFGIPHYYVQFRYLANGNTYTAEIIHHKNKLITGNVKDANGKGCKIRTITLSKITNEVKDYVADALDLD